VLGYGDWIRLFRRCGLVIEDLIELRPPVGATTTHGDYVPLDWARRWPAEAIWVTRRPEPCLELLPVRDRAATPR